MRNYRGEYDKYHKSSDQKKKRASRNSARKKMVKAGKAKKGDGKDVHHKNGNPRDNSRSNLKMKSKSTNRSIPRNSKAKKR
jgi:hypothetical protein